MNKLAVLLGGTTKGNIVEALALSGKPLTAYRVARAYNMNVAKVYVEMKKLAAIGVVRSEKGGRGLEYGLVDSDLRRLATRLSTRVQPYDSWRSKKSKMARFRMGFALVPRLPLEGRAAREGKTGKRMPGELDNIASLGRTMFDSKYRRSSRRRYARV